MRRALRAHACIIHAHGGARIRPCIVQLLLYFPNKCDLFMIYLRMVRCACVCACIMCAGCSVASYTIIRPGFVCRWTDGWVRNAPRRHMPRAVVVRWRQQTLARTHSHHHIAGLLAGCVRVPACLLRVARRLGVSERIWCGQMAAKWVWVGDSRTFTVIKSIVHV